MNGELVVRGVDGLPKTHELNGKIGYKLMEEQELLRVWDDEQTFLISLDQLITFRMTEQRSE